MITYEMIYEASNGDISALNSLIKQFQYQINILATKKIISNEKVKYIIDVDLRDQLVSKIIDLTLGFDPFPKYDGDVENE